MGKDITVIVPCLILNQFLLGLTQQCFESLRKTAPEAELIAVDCASPMGGEYLAETADIYIRNLVRKGPIRAANQGLKLATGDYIAFGNNDIIFLRGWQDVLCNMVDTIPDCGIAYPVNEGEIVKDTVPWKETTADGFFLFRRETSDRVGLFDESYLNCGALADWVLRMETLGLYIYASPDIIFPHRRSSTFRELSKKGEWHPGWDEVLGRKRFREKWGREL